MHTFLEKIDHFYCQKILKPLLSLSKLGRTSVMGKADSGLNFDHMYRNKPKGITQFGKFIDRVLLNLPSVKATRNRKDIIIKILQNEVTNNIIMHKKTRIVDIASGPARYLSELINNFNQDKIEILCFDKDRRSLNFGKILSRGKPMRFVKADVFNLRKIKNFADRTKWKPNIIISSGLFEYLEEVNVMKILSDIYNSIDYEGLLIFASQRDNPSRKLMSRVCTTQNGKPWDLFYRDPEWFRKTMLDIGFKSVIISIDKWGMYEFCTGRKYK